MWVSWGLKFDVGFESENCKSYVCVVFYYVVYFASIFAVVRILYYCLWILSVEMSNVIDT